MGFCLNCLKDVDYDIIERTETVTVIDTPITDIQQVCICKACGTEIWEKEIEEKNLRRLYDKYRNLKGLLAPEDIKKIRDKYGLTQAEFAEITGLTEKNIKHYEGGSIQNRIADNLIYLLSFEDNLNALRYRKK